MYRLLCSAIDAFALFGTSREPAAASSPPYQHLRAAVYGRTLGSRLTVLSQESAAWLIWRHSSAAAWRGLGELVMLRELLITRFAEGSA